MSESEARREFTRVPIHVWGTFADPGGERLTAQVDTLSLRGCHVSTFDPLPAGGRYHLTLFLDDDARALRFAVEARVVTSGPDGMGVEFMEMPLDSYEHLRNMVLLNAPDPARVEREFRAHLGLRPAG